MQEFALKDHEPSLLPDGNWTLVWNDEFDGTELDRTKWDYRLSMMGKRHPAWTDKGVHLDGKSNAVFTVLEEDGRPVSSQLQTGYNFMDEPVVETTFGHDHLQWNIGKLKQPLFMHSYGYYECRCKVQKNPGWWCAFWIQSPIIGCCPNPAVAGVEVDIMECFYPDKKTWSANNHWGGYGPDHQHEGTGELPLPDSEDGFHTFGLLWTPEKYVYYMDGKEVGQLSKAVSQVEQFLLISTEAMGYRASFHHDPILKKEYAGDAFIVDYVRVFDEVE